MIRTLDNFTRKFKTLEEIVKIVETFRSERIIVAKNGSYDIIHPGHIRALYESKAQGEMLIVGLDSDESIRKRKGKGRPINPQRYRAEVLTAIECVDFVTLIEDSVEFVKAIKPHVYTNGPEWGENCKEAETVKRNGGKIYIYQRHDNYSTTDLIRRIKNAQ